MRWLWTEEGVTYRGVHYTVDGSTVAPPPFPREGGGGPTLYFGGASESADQSLRAVRHPYLSESARIGDGLLPLLWDTDRPA